MTIFQTVRPKFIPILCLVAYLISASANAQLAVENALKEDLLFRGQGRANLCFAFAEEQILKDKSCTTNCELNSDQWKFSIFDIAKVHQSKWIQDHGAESIQVDLVYDLLSQGSSEVFPYKNVGVQTVRASKCTLEKEIFLLNRSTATNPDGEQIQDFLMALYPKLKSGTFRLPTEARTLSFTNAIAALTPIARQSSSSMEFLQKSIDHTLCSDRLTIPTAKVNAEKFTNVSQTRQFVNDHLMRKKSLYVGVCAEVLETENVEGSECGRHAVVLKNIRKGSCEKCEKEIQVVDSAFFSRRARDRDGSIWIPSSIVVNAMTKWATDTEQILAKEPEVDTTEFSQSIQSHLKAKLINTPPRALNAKVLVEIKAYLNPYNTDAIASLIAANIIDEVSLLPFRSLGELDQIPDIVQRSIVLALKSQSSRLVLSGIIWLE